MKKILFFVLVTTFLLSMTACSGYNGIMREHLSNEDNYYTIEATFCSHNKDDERIYLYVTIEDKSAFDSSEKSSKETLLELVGDNCQVLGDFFENKEIKEGDKIIVRCSTWIYMDSTFYYVAELKTHGETLLSFDEGLQSIVKYVNDNKSLF